MFDLLVLRQAGVVSLGQAIACGLSADLVHRRARSGVWARLYPGVYLVGGHRYTDEVRVRAAALWAGERGAISGASAAWWHGMLTQAPPYADLTLPRHLHRAAPPRTKLHRRDLLPVDVTEVRGVRVTARPLTVLDTAVALGRTGSTFLDRALQRHVRFPAVHRAFCRNMGRPGAAEAGRLLIAAADRADSAAERLLIRLLRDAGLTGWVVGHPFGPFRIDVAFPERKLAIEVDGWAWHVDVERFRNDRRKGNALAADRWDLLRYTWHELDGGPTDCVAEIEQTLAPAA